MADWDTAYVNSLPDSAFACPEKRKYPHHNRSGALDLPHLRAALSRVGDPSNDQCGKGHLMGHRGALPSASKARAIDIDHFQLLAIPFGGPIPTPHYAKGMDMDLEFFSERTDIMPDLFPARPVFWHHGAEGMYNPRELQFGTARIGKADGLHMEDDGWWVDIWVEAGERRRRLIQQLAERAPLYGSPQTLVTMAKKASTGEILVYPYVEQTISTAPNNTRSTVRPAKALADIEAADIDVAAPVKALLRRLDDLLPHLDPSPDGLAKAGRVLSARNEQALRRVLDELASVLAQLPQEPTVTT
jgi:hypothetical protein